MAKHRKIAITLLIIVVLLGSGAYFAQDWIRKQFFEPTTSVLENGITSSKGRDVKVVAENLNVPWGIDFLPDGSMLVTERSGTLRRIDSGKAYNIEGVKSVGEGGLLGLALHPNFAENGWIYLYLTTAVQDETINRVERYKYSDDSLIDRTVILNNIPGSQNHDGGRIAFGPEGYLYITTGDAQEEELSQDRSSLAGKILRITDRGEPPNDNPAGNSVYSYGHRNPQGLAWDDSGRLWATEHGRSGVRSGFDELNLIKSGANYGWPVVEGDKARQDMESPLAHSGPSETWAPASLAFKNGSFFFGGLRGEALYQAVLGEGDSITLKAHFRGEYGRIRTVIVGPDGYLYMTTSNNDGRGDKKPNDDKIIRVNPNIFAMD